MKEPPSKSNICEEAALGICRILIQTSILLRKEMDRVFLPAGITGPQFGILSLLEKEGSMPLGEIGKRLWVSCGNITGLVDKLAAAGLLRRDRLSSDRRVILAELTEKGRNLVRELRPAHRETIMRFTAGLEECEYQELQALLGKLYSPSQTIHQNSEESDCAM